MPLPSLATYFSGPLRLRLAALSGAAFLLCMQAPTLPANSDSAAVKAIERTMPAVLSISTFHSGRRLSGDVENVASGFFIDKQGHLVTNAHVLDAGGHRLEVLVTTQDGQELMAHPVAVDWEADLALLRVQAPAETRFRYLNMRRLSDNKLGQTVIALGNPVGYGNSISKGVLSAADRSVSLEGMVYEGLLQTDAAINPGSSGGPIVDLNGRLVGVSSVKLAFDEAGMPLQGIGFAIPAARVAQVLEQMASRGPEESAAPAKVRSERGFLTSWLPRFGGRGKMQSVPVPQLLEALGVELYQPDDQGSRRVNEPPRIAEIYLDSAAERAGLKTGEYVFRVDRLPLDVGNDFTQASVMPGQDGTQNVELEVGSIVRREGRYWKQVRVVRVEF